MPDFIDDIIQHGPWAAFCVLLFWRLWKVSDRERETVRQVTERERESYREMIDALAASAAAQKEMADTQQKLFDRVSALREGLKWRQ